MYVALECGNDQIGLLLKKRCVGKNNGPLRVEHINTGISCASCRSKGSVLWKPSDFCTGAMDGRLWQRCQGGDIVLTN